MIEFLNRQTNPGAPPHDTNKKYLWSRLFLLSIFSIYFYVFMEWLFFITKPSFMDVLTIGNKVDVLLSTSLLIVALWLPFFLLLWGLSCLPGIVNKWYLLPFAGGLFPALFLSITTLLLVDNFTYTLFKFGIVSTNGIARLVYSVLVLIIFILWYRWVIRRLRVAEESPQKSRFITPYTFGIGLLVISAVSNIPKLQYVNILNSEVKIQGRAEHPNILIIGSDGVNASNTSLYGYDRDTTPNLRHLADESLVAENAFTNSAKSSGSIISIFTSKLPTKTRVIYPPDILRNSDAYQHLPGILRSLGYHTVEISIPHYIDAYTFNLRDGFDIVNERSLDQAGFNIFVRSPAFQEFGYFFSVLAERVSDRLSHIYFVRQMSNPYQEVTTDQLPNGDLYRVRKLINTLKKADQPLFVHVHLMGTHGERFTFQQQVFSTGQIQYSPWMTDFYDDAIYQFDHYIGEVWSDLSKIGMLDNTIIVIYSDHGQEYATDQKVPLMIRFPNGDFAGRIRSNSQNLDIAPTILDYMGIPVPQWMEGNSLLRGEPDSTRPIYSAGVDEATTDEGGNWVIDDERIEPPFYQFAYLQAIVCQNWYYIDLIDYYWDQGEVVGHTAPCDSEALPQDDIIRSMMMERLEKDGFDTSVLQEQLIAPQP